MRLPVTEHTGRPWRIHEVVPDFRVEDVWAFRMPGAGADDFPAVLSVLRDAGKPDGQPLVVRFLFAVRWKLGALFGWDEPKASVASLRDRLPADLRATSNGADPALPIRHRLPRHDPAMGASLARARRDHCAKALMSVDLAVDAECIESRQQRSRRSQTDPRKSL